MNKIIDVKGKYNMELNEIVNTLEQLKNNKIYDLTGVKMDGSLSYHIQELTNKLVDLIEKIEYGKTSDFEKIKEASDKLSKILTDNQSQ